MTTPSAIRWDKKRLELELLDQRQLPEAVSYLSIGNLEQACDAISSLAVRGAPAIGIAAAYAMIVCARDVEPRRRLSTLEAAAQRLKSARPTAVNLAWAVDRLLAEAQENPDLDALHDVALAIHSEDRAICQAIGRAGQHLIKDGSRVLTHCNAGALAVSELGTATAPMYLSHRAGVSFKVFADETRPLLQGARLTAWELDRAGIDVTLICDSAAASLMAAGQIDLVLVGTDRVTRNGDVVNKIGTLSLAVLCRYFDVPFFVACPTSTFDPSTPTGAEVEIEQRAPGEVLNGRAARVKALNPAFDVTPANLVTGLITDIGLIDYSTDNALAPLLKNR